MIAHPYFRFSHTDQACGTSIERQRDLASELVGRRGWQLAEEYVDEAKSASTGRNRQDGADLHRFEREAMQGLHHGKVLVVEHLDRLSREGPEATYQLINSLRLNGVNIATVDDEGFYKAGQSLDFVQIIMILSKAQGAREEVKKKGKRVKDAHARRRAMAAATGCDMGKLAPYWVDIAGGQYVANPDRAALVLRMFEMADAGDGALTIAKKLNDEKVPVWQRWAKRPVRAWDRNRIRKILGDDAVLGWRRGKGDPIRIYPQIVPCDLFERVRAQAPVRAMTKGGAKSGLVKNLVSGLATCELCGSPMMYRKHNPAGATYRTRPAGNLAVLKSESASLVCNAGHHRGCQNRAGISYLSFERALLDAALHVALDDKAFTRGDELGRLNRELAEQRHTLELTRARAERLWEAWASDEASDMRRKLAEKAEQETVALEAVVAALSADRIRAAGCASAEEHLARISLVRSRLTDPDLAIRKLHRKKVMEGLRSVISHIWCGPDKVATVVFAGGMAALKIQQGKVIERADAVAMFDDGKFASLRVPERQARAVHERMSDARDVPSPLFDPSATRRAAVSV